MTTIFDALRLVSVPTLYFDNSPRPIGYQPNVIVVEGRRSRSKAPDPDMLTTTQAAERASVSTKTIRRWLKDGKLRTHWAGKRIRVAKTELDAFLRSAGNSASETRSEAVERILRRMRK